MNGIYKFLGAFCATSAVMGALYLLLPEGSFKKPVKYAFCICFLCLILSSFSVALKGNDVLNFDTEVTDVKDMSKEAVVLTLKTALKNAGINFSDLSIITSKNENGGIDIIEINVRSPDSPQKIKEILNIKDCEVNVINE